MDYKEKIKDQIMCYFANIDKTFDIYKTSIGKIHTTIPNDKFQIINSCLDVIKANLHNSYIKEFAVLLLQSFRDDMRVVYDQLNTKKIDILCAFANDYNRTIILCMKLNDDMHNYGQIILQKKFLNY